MAFCITTQNTKLTDVSGATKLIQVNVLLNFSPGGVQWSVMTSYFCRSLEPYETSSSHRNDCFNLSFTESTRHDTCVTCEQEGLADANGSARQR